VVELLDHHLRRAGEGDDAAATHGEGVRGRKVGDEDRQRVDHRLLTSPNGPEDGREEVDALDDDVGARGRRLGGTGLRLCRIECVRAGFHLQRSAVDAAEILVDEIEADLHALADFRERTTGRTLEVHHEEIDRLTVGFDRVGLCFADGGFPLRCAIAEDAVVGEQVAHRGIVGHRIIGRGIVVSLHGCFVLFHCLFRLRVGLGGIVAAAVIAAAFGLLGVGRCSRLRTVAAAAARSRHHRKDRERRKELREFHTWH